MMTPSRARASSNIRAAILTDIHDILARGRIRGLKSVAVHQVHPGFQSPAGGRPDAGDFERYKRKLRRRCERSPALIQFAGVTEPSFNVSGNTGKWQLQCHGVAAVRAADMETALLVAKHVFRVKTNASLGIHVPLHVNALDKAKGGLRGALGYAAKSFEERGVTRRSSYVDDRGRWNTRDLSLRASEQRDLDLIFEAVLPQAQVVLHGIRRVGGHFMALQ